MAALVFGLIDIPEMELESVWMVCFSDGESFLFRKNGDPNVIVRFFSSFFRSVTRQASKGVEITFSTPLISEGFDRISSLTLLGMEDVDRWYEVLNSGSSRNISSGMISINTEIELFLISLAMDKIQAHDTAQILSRNGYNDIEYLPRCGHDKMVGFGVEEQLVDKIQRGLSLGQGGTIKRSSIFSLDGNRRKVIIPSIFGDKSSSNNNSKESESEKSNKESSSTTSSLRNKIKIPSIFLGLKRDKGNSEPEQKVEEEEKKEEKEEEKEEKKVEKKGKMIIKDYTLLRQQAEEKENENEKEEPKDDEEKDEEVGKEDIKQEEEGENEKEEEKVPENQDNPLFNPEAPPIEEQTTDKEDGLNEEIGGTQSEKEELVIDLEGLGDEELKKEIERLRNEIQYMKGASENDRVSVKSLSKRIYDLTKHNEELIEMMEDYDQMRLRVNDLEEEIVQSERHIKSLSGRISRPSSTSTSSVDEQELDGLFDVVTVSGRSYWVIGQSENTVRNKILRVLTREGRVLAVKCVDLKDLTDEMVRKYFNELSLFQELQKLEVCPRIERSDNQSENQLLMMVVENGEVDMRDFIANNRNARFSLICETFWQLVKLIEPLHEMDLIHGDIQPKCFMFFQQRLMMVDCGIAGELFAGGEGHPNPHELRMGSINYRAPETFSGDMELWSEKTDVWSLGCILHEMVFGYSPFEETPLIKKVKTIRDFDKPVELPVHPNEHLTDLLERTLIVLIFDLNHLSFKPIETSNRQNQYVGYPLTPLHLLPKQPLLDRYGGGRGEYQRQCEEFICWKRRLLTSINCN